MGNRNTTVINTQGLLKQLFYETVKHLPIHTHMCFAISRLQDILNTLFHCNTPASQPQANQPQPTKTPNKQIVKIGLLNMVLKITTSSNKIDPQAKFDPNPKK
jgi:hypothetical protein